MALTLCSNCRLPVQESAHRCHQCSAELGSVASRRVPVAAAVALVATLAMLARRRA